MAVVNLESFLVRLAAPFLVLPLVLSLAFPLTVSATIYKWIDEGGTTVYSNRPPAAGARVSNLQVAMRDEEQAAAAKPANPDDLQARLRSLEQQIQSLQSPPPQSPPPNYAPPPPIYYAPPDYYPQQSDPSYSADSMYGYPYYPYYPSYIVVTGKRFLRPAPHPIRPGFVGRPGARPEPVSQAMSGSGATAGARRR